MTKYVYSFGGGDAEGDATMRNTLGGKGANLAEMAKIGLPVPAGFTITCESCDVYFEAGGQFPQDMKDQVLEALKKTEAVMGMKYGDSENPLLISARSGARQSMPGMMETVLNVGLCSATIPGLVKKSGSERFVYDAYRRLITMYSDVVMEKSEDIEPEEGKGIRIQLEGLMDELKEAKGYKEDTDMTVEDLKVLCEQYKAKVKEVLGKDFPDDPMDQLWGAAGAVFKSWNGRRAIAYRQIEGIPGEWGTACNVQSMVFGNMGDTSATGVAFSRNPATGENKFYGEWLVNAQGEDVVAGIRTPSPLNEETKNSQNEHLSSLETEWPELYKELHDIRDNLEAHYHDMQDIEFTIQDKKLYMLQCRNGKRTGVAALNMAMDMIEEGLIDEETAVTRVAPAQLDELLHPLLDPKAEAAADVVVKGLPAGPGGAVGKVVFTSADAVAMHEKGEHCILVREETNPEDVEGMRAAEGILTARGGMTSHAALVCRGWGKCCIVGAGELKIDAVAKKVSVGGVSFGEGDLMSLNGTKGNVYAGGLATIDATENPRLKGFMEIVDKFRTMGVRTNADTPEDAKIAKDFGAEGIGLFRTEHMFYGAGSEAALFELRKMILSETAEERQKGIDGLAPYVKKDIKATLEAMDSMPVTIRLLDPPLHEFAPTTPEGQEEVAKALGISVEDVQNRVAGLHEVNPMMGHRGVRLGITYPDADRDADSRHLRSEERTLGRGVRILCRKSWFRLPVPSPNWTKRRRSTTRSRPKSDASLEIPYGTMIEIPRACLLANKMAETAEFFSFGTNDLTQMGFGFSRDDIGGFLPDYVKQGILEADPFQTIDQEGIGQLIEMAVTKGRATRENLKIGICGEQGGDPASVDFCFKNGLNYVSCSPYRVPIARLSAAQSAIAAKKCGCGCSCGK